MTLSIQNNDYNINHNDCFDKVRAGIKKYVEGKGKITNASKLYIIYGNQISLLQLLLL